MRNSPWLQMATRGCFIGKGSGLFVIAAPVFILGFLQPFIGNLVMLFSFAGIACFFPGSGNHFLNFHFFLQFEEIATAALIMLFIQLFCVLCQGSPGARGGIFPQNVHVLGK